MGDEASQSSTPPAEGGKAEDTGAKPSEHAEATEATDDTLADPGKRALESERRARRAAERERTQLQAEMEALRLSQKSEHEQMIEKARREGTDEAEKVWKGRFHDAIRRQEALRVMSAKGVTAPDLVMPHLHLDDVEVDEDGKPDSSAIEAALATVLETYPMLSAANGQSSIHHADIGPRSKPAQTTDASSALRQALGAKSRR